MVKLEENHSCHRRQITIQAQPAAAKVQTIPPNTKSTKLLQEQIEKSRQSSSG